MKLKNLSLKLAVIFLIAFLARLIALNQSLWLDEGVTARVVQQYSISQIISQFSPGDFHPPLFYIVEKIWTSLFGYSEVALRFPSLLFSLITGWIAFNIGKFLKDETTGLWATLFFLFNPLIVYYSQEARMYMMVTCFLTASLYFFVKILKKTSSRDITFFNVFVFLSFLTFYGSVFFIAGMYIYLLWKRKMKDLLFLLPGFALAIIIIAPLLSQQLMNSRGSLQSVTNWRQVLGEANLKDLFLFPLKFSIGRISFYPKVLYYLVAGIWSLGVFILAFTKVKKNVLIMFLFLVPIILGYFFSLFSPLLQYFRFLYLLPLLTLLLAISVNKDWQQIMLLIGFLVWTGCYLLIPANYREDWKGLASSLSSTAKVYTIPSSMEALRYYLPDLKIQDFRSLTTNSSPAQIVVIPYTLDIYGIDYTSQLSIKGYKSIKVRDFRGVSFEIWRKS